jgi:antitoxin component YwqK of YwqJK toxin-antitoxin module
MKYFKVIITSAIMLNCVLANSQSISKKYTTVNINEKDGYIRIMVSNKDYKIKPNETYTYYWYAYNNVMSTKGGYDGKLLQGVYSEFYATNNLKEKGQFKKGLKYGEWISWFDNGKIREISHWRNSLKNGNRKVFNENGELTLEENYSDDVFNGEVMQYNAGKMVSQKFYKHGAEYEPKSIRKKNEQPKDTITKSNTIVKNRNNTNSPEKKSGNIFARVKALFNSKKKDSVDTNSNITQQTKN